MTLRGCLPAPPSPAQCCFDLLKKVVRGNAKAQQRQSQDRVTIDADVVLPQRVLDDVLGVKVVDAVNLDDYSEGFPVDVEEIAPTTASSHHLPVRIGQSSLPTFLSDIELTQGLGATKQVQQHGLDEPSAFVPADSEKGPCDVCRGRQPLLDNHRQDQCRLPVALRPQRSVHGSHLRANPRHTVRLDVFATPATRLADVDARRAKGVGTTGHRDALSILYEAGQTGGDKTRDSVECSPGTRLEHC